MNIASISHVILDETSSPEALQDALFAFVQMCSDITGILPDPSFDAWARDTLLDSGVAINPNAAAHCAIDYQRSAVFIRGINAAIQALRSRFPTIPLEILYAGCGPFATLLLPLLGKFSIGEINLNLLDIHQRSIDSVELLLTHFGLDAYTVRTFKGDACRYKHDQKVHLVVAETMQKSLEQEPQFAVTANLAPQLFPGGIFIPQRIEVALCLADLEYEKEVFTQSSQVDPSLPDFDSLRHPIATVCTLTPENATAQIGNARHCDHNGILELQPTTVTIPTAADTRRLDAALFTRITVFKSYRLADYESEITLPLKCHEIATSTAGARYRISYQLGTYPRFNFEYLDS